MTQAALDRIDSMGENLFDQLWAYTNHYTSTTRAEFEEMWNAALAGAQGYASFLDAMNAAQAGTYYNSSSFGTGSASGSSANVLLVQELIDKMKANSASWFTSNDQAGLDSQNKSYAAQISTLLGGANVTRDNNGVWWLDGQKLYEITAAALEKYNEAVDAFNSFGTTGSYFAVPSSSITSGTAGGSSSAGNSGTSVSAASSELAASIIAKMKANAAAWFTSSNPDALANENVQLAKQLEHLLGVKVVKRGDGYWYYGAVGGARVFHNGGIAGTSTLKQDELFALIKNKEMILNETQQNNLMAMLDQLKPLNALKEVLTSFRSGAFEVSQGGAAPYIDASINIDGYTPDDQMMGVLQRHERKVANMVMKYFTVK